MCEKKKFTKIEAAGALNYNKKRHWYSRKLTKRRKEIRYYHCDECNSWHLTSKENGENRGGTRDVVVLEKERWEKLLNHNYE